MSRFVPTLKARFEYGATIFLLTYALVGVSGYRVQDVAPMALQRLLTVSIGALICVAVCALVSPVWAGQELQHLVARHINKLANAIEGFVVEDLLFFSESGGVDGDGAAARETPPPLGHIIMSVLNAKASEDSLANLAAWEFGFRHPYGHYQAIGAATRRCACCVDALIASCVAGSETRRRHQTPAHITKHLDSTCAALSRQCAAVLRVASASVSSMTLPAGRLELTVGDMNASAEELRTALRRLTETILEENNKASSGTVENEHQLPSSGATQNRARSHVEALPLFTAASLLLKICTRVEGVVHAVTALATTAEFENSDDQEEHTLDNEASKPLLKKRGYP